MRAVREMPGAVPVTPLRRIAIRDAVDRLKQPREVRRAVHECLDQEDPGTWADDLTPEQIAERLASWVICDST